MRVWEHEKKKKQLFSKKRVVFKKSIMFGIMMKIYYDKKLII